MKITHLTILFAALTFTIAPLVMADNHTDSEEVQENLSERIKEYVSSTEINEVAEPKLYGCIGEVTDIIQNTIILKDKEGKKSIRINDDSTILRSPGSKEIDLESVRITDSIIAIGNLTTEDEITGRRIIVSVNELTPPKKISGLATITSIDKYSFTLQVDDSEEPLELFFTKSTIYKSPTEILELTDLSVGDEILYNAGLDSDEDWSATIVMQIKPSELDSPDYTDPTSTDSE